MENIKFQDWQKMDFKIGEILEIGDHPNADKLYVMKVDVGEESPRTIVAGLKGYYPKEELVKKKIVVFTNLQPAELRGVKSEGMLLAAEKDGNVVLISPEKEIDSGAEIR